MLYDGASNMVGIRSGVSCNSDTKRRTSCHISSLLRSFFTAIAVCHTVKQIKTMVDALDVTNEISKLLKYSPKRDAMFNKLKKELAPDTSGFRVLGPTRWTVRANSLQSVVDNWEPLNQLWEDCLLTKLDSEVKA